MYKREKAAEAYLLRRLFLPMPVLLSSSCLSAHCLEGLAVRTLRLSRILLMRTNLDLAQSTVFPTVAMIFTGIDNAFDAVVFVAFVHNYLLSDHLSILLFLTLQNI